MMQEVYCEFCREPLRHIHTPESYLRWLEIVKEVARCARHKRTSRRYRRYSPATGRRVRAEV